MSASNASITALLQSALRDYIDKAADEVKDIIQEFIQQYYDEYSPQRYERTYQFLNSLIRTEVNSVGGKISCMVYIDTSTMNYSSAGGSTTPSGQQVVDWAAQGIHGGSIFGGDPFWNNAMQKISDEGIMTVKFASYLMQKGFQVIGI